MTFDLAAVLTALAIGQAPVHLVQPPPLLIHERIYYADSGLTANQVDHAFAALMRAEGGE